MKVEILSWTHELKSRVFHKAVTQGRSFCNGKQGEMEEVTSSASRLTHYALLCDEEDPANALSGQENGEQHEVLWMEGAEGKRKGDSFVNGSKLHSPPLPKNASWSTTSHALAGRNASESCWKIQQLSLSSLAHSVDAVGHVGMHQVTSKLLAKLKLFSPTWFCEVFGACCVKSPKVKSEQAVREMIWGIMTHQTQQAFDLLDGPEASQKAQSQGERAPDEQEVGEERHGDEGWRVLCRNSTKHRIVILASG